MHIKGVRLYSGTRWINLIHENHRFQKVTPPSQILISAILFSPKWIKG